MSEEKTIKTAIKNMNIYLDERHDDNDTITMTAKVLRSIRDNYCELLRYKVAVEGMNAIIQQNNSKLDLQADYKTLYEDLKAEHIETVKAIKQAKSEAVRGFADKVNLIVEELVDIMFDGNDPKCKISNCHKHSSISCESPTCIEENKAYWKARILTIVKEMVGDSECTKR